METAMTMMVDPLEEKLVQSVKDKLLEKLKSSKSAPLGTYRGADVYSLGDSQNGYAVLAKNSEILYFVRYTKVNANGLRFGRQVLVWSAGSTSTSATGFASHMFFDVLLPKYKALIADSMQTSAGQRFWRYAIDRALKDNGRYVYFLNRRSTPNQLIPIRTLEDLLRLEPELWGADAGHLRTHAVISNMPLRIKEAS